MPLRQDSATNSRRAKQRPNAPDSGITFTPPKASNPTWICDSGVIPGRRVETILNNKSIDNVNHNENES